VRTLIPLKRSRRDEVDIETAADIREARQVLSPLDMVMVGHLYHPRFSDGDRLPASLSASAVHALRADGYIGFKGVVVSDDMGMGAVRERYSLEDRVIKAINAGIDLLVFSNVKSRDPDLGIKLHAMIAQAVRDGRIPRARIEAAYGRIVELKLRLMQHDLAGKGEVTAE
jgi:beta-N-acetylhexosaminidase